MEERTLLSFRVRWDPERTENWYREAPPWGCDCGHCRNFLALARENALPERVRRVLEDLGIPPEKATYVSELYTDEAGVHYQFSYRVAGSVLEGPAQEAPEFGRCCREPYPYGAPGFAEPHFDVEFWETLPWVLD